MSPVIAILGSLLVATLLTAPLGVYEYHKRSGNEVQTRSVISIPGAEPVPVHIPMVALTTPVNYSVPYWLGGYAVTVPSPAVWTLPSTYNDGGKVQLGEFLQIRNYGPGVITLVTTAPETIEGLANYAIPVGNTVKVLSNYPNWVVTSQLSASNDVRYYGAKCDGVTDDTVALQSALAALTNYSSLYFPPGNCISGKLHTPSGLFGVTIYGAGGGTSQITRKSGVAFGSPAFFMINACTYCVVRDLKIVADPTLIGSTLYGDQSLLINNCAHTLVSGVHISLGLVTGIMVSGSQNTTVTLCDIYGWADNVSNPVIITGIGGYGIGVIDGSVGTVITQNKVASGFNGIGIQEVSPSFGISDTVISDNEVVDQAGYGIFLYNLGIGVFRTSITSNYISRIWGSTINSATNGYSFGAGIYCVSFYDVAITGNVIEYTNLRTNDSTLAPAAIGINGGNYVMGHFSITGNVLRQYDDSEYPGIVIKGVAASANGSRQVSGNSFMNCYFQAVSTTELDVSANSIKPNWYNFAAIALFNVTNSDFSTNRLSAYKNGIVDDVPSYYNTYTGNQFIAYTTTSQGYSISGRYAQLSSNYAKGGLRGFNIINSAASITLTDNVVWGAGAPYVFNVGDGLRVAGNVGVPLLSTNPVFTGFTPFTQTITGTTSLTVTGGMQYASVDCATGTRVVTDIVGGYAGQTITFVATNGVAANFTLPSSTFVLPTTRGYLYLPVGTGATATFLRLDTAPTNTWVLTSTTAW